MKIVRPQASNIGSLSSFSPSVFLSRSVHGMVLPAEQVSCCSSCTNFFPSRHPFSLLLPHHMTFSSGSVLVGGTILEHCDSASSARASQTRVNLVSHCCYSREWGMCTHKLTTCPVLACIRRHFGFISSYLSTSIREGRCGRAGR